MSEKLVRLEKFDSGLQPDLPDRQKTFWRDGENVLFKDSAILPAPGQIPLNAFGRRFTAVCSTGTHVFLGQLKDITVWNVAAQSQSTLVASIDSPTGWHFVAWGTWVIGVNAGKLYKITTSSIEEISNAPTGIKFLLKVKNFILAVSADTVYWCSDDDVTDWTPKESNMAGDLFIRDCSSEIITGAALESFAILATKDELIRISYVSRPYVFSYQKIYAGAGAYTDKSICVLNNTVFGLGASGAWVCNGQSVQFIDQNAVSSLLLDELDLGRTSEILLGVWETLHFVLFFIPVVDGTKCFVFNLDNNLWTKLTLSRILQDKEYWVSLNGVLFRDDLRFAGTSPTNAGSLILPEAGKAGIGYGTEGYGPRSYGGKIFLNLEEL